MGLIERSQVKLKFTAASILLSCAGACLAQGTPEVGHTVAEASADSGEGLAEVVVTAQKRAENLQSVPVSVTAINSRSRCAAHSAWPAAV